MRKHFAAVLRFLADRFDPPQLIQTARASTQFAGSPLRVNQYGADLSKLSSIEDAVSWATKRRRGGSI